MTVDIAEDDVPDKSLLLKHEVVDERKELPDETRHDRVKTNILEGEWDAEDKAREEQMMEHRKFLEEQARLEALENISGESTMRKALPKVQTLVSGFWKPKLLN